ncbi:MAG: GNAT family N-acetyltransferase [Chloroflexi bacterium]|nr:GNAT family N-acetyltransferase [Chloroflexota bacterium]
MSEQPALNIRQFLPTDIAPVHELFVNGLMEFSGEAELEFRRYVNHSLKDDMADIPAQYLASPRSNFWVAESAGLVVGMVAIQPGEAAEEAELRRMSVSPLVRRQGVGRRLLETAEDFCRDQGYRRICLSSVDLLAPALEMYLRFGYTTVKEEPYGDPPHRPIVVHHMAKDLDQVI